MVIWLIGLSGSGKSTLGRELFRQLQATQPNTVLLDGDELRSVFAHDSGDEPYSLQGRRLNAERVVALCEMLDKQGINVICCILSVFQDMRDANRHLFSRYLEIFMDAPVEVLMKRDVKGLYEAACSGEVKNVVGVDIEFLRPVGSDLIIDSSGNCEDISELARIVLKKLN